MRSLSEKTLCTLIRVLLIQWSRPWHSSRMESGSITCTLDFADVACVLIWRQGLDTSHCNVSHRQSGLWSFLRIRDRLLRANMARKTIHTLEISWYCCEQSSQVSWCRLGFIIQRTITTLFRDTKFATLPEATMSSDIPTSNDLGVRDHNDIALFGVPRRVGKLTKTKLN